MQQKGEAGPSPSKGKEVNEIVREELLWEKYTNLLEFLTMECFPNANLDQLFKKMNEKLTPTDLFHIMGQTLVKDWPGSKLSISQVRIILDQVMGRIAVANPEFFKGITDPRVLSSQNLDDKQVDKIYRYCQYFVYIVTQL